MLFKKNINKKKIINFSIKFGIVTISCLLFAWYFGLFENNLIYYHFEISKEELIESILKIKNSDTNLIPTLKFMDMDVDLSTWYVVYILDKRDNVVISLEIGRDKESGQELKPGEFGKQSVLLLFNIYGTNHTNHTRHRDVWTKEQIQFFEERILIPLRAQIEKDYGKKK